jgi:beta-glucosidase
MTNLASLKMAPRDCRSFVTDACIASSFVFKPLRSGSILRTFPNDFLWGAATSAYQIEGSPTADGAGESIWHRFSHRRGTIADGTNGDVTCDHYRRYAGDVELMRELGLNAYRFSTSWSRVLPEGVGRVNQAGLDFYSRLIDTLLQHGIRPMLTLYHWDLPQALEDRGGWANPQVVDWFAEYAQLMYRTFDDRVPLWCTINEPWVIADQGYVEGRHAPGRRDWAEAATVSKILLRAHAAAVDAYRSIGKHEVGLVVNLVPVHPASDSEADRAAANRLDAYLNRQYLDPSLLGVIPPELPQMFGDAWHDWSDDDLRRVQRSIDFLGINYYLRLLVRDDPTCGPARARAVAQPGSRRTAMDWEIFPRGLTDTLVWLKSRYGDVAQHITENGAAFDEPSSAEKGISDTDRIDSLNEHLVAARQALEAGVNLQGYFAWSLLDNFEWQCGHAKRFGIVHVNFANQQRTPKASARFYAEVIRSSGASLRDINTPSPSGRGPG